MISTAEEFCNEKLGFEEYGTDIPYFMIEFAKIHVKEALREASKNAECLPNYFDCIDPQSILNAYPLENIK